MRPTRLLGAATAVLVTGTLLGSAPASATDDNARSRWDSKRVVQLPDAADGAVHVLGGRNTWSMVARELGAGTDTWRLRESRSGDLGYTTPLLVPREVSRFRYDESQAQDSTYAAYEYQGRLYAAVHSPASVAMDGSLDSYNLAAVAPGTEAPKVTAGETSPDAAIITQGGTWYLHVGQVETPQTAPQGDTGDPGSRWVAYPDPNVDGVPGNAGENYAFADGGLLVFWNDAKEDLHVARSGPGNPPATQPGTLPFQASKQVATGERYVHYVQTATGGRLVTQSTDGSVNLYTYTSDAAGFSFTDKRVLAGALVDAPAPQVLVDALGTLTIGFRETGAPGGGLMLWQQDRPLGRLLERASLVPGTRGSDARVVSSPRGNLTVAFRRDGEPGIVRVKHLPAGKRSWTGGIRLVSPKPNATSTGWGIATPQRDGDLRVAVNDTVGVYGIRFDAPAPYTKMTRPVRTVQQQRNYRVAANTSWAFAHEWQMRARVDKGRSYGAWSPVSLPDGENGKDVTRPRGEKRCYSARGETIDGGWTRWSPQQCVTVRR